MCILLIIILIGQFHKFLLLMNKQIINVYDILLFKIDSFSLLSPFSATFKDNIYFTSLAFPDLQP